MLVFTELLLLVEGLEVFVVFSFDRVVVVVGRRCRSARRVAVGMVLWLRVVAEYASYRGNSSS